MKIKKFLILCITIGICELAGIIGSVFTFSAIPDWYQTLNKPIFSPPNWIFGPVWVILYALMGTAAFLVWEKGIKYKQVKVALLIFGVQLVLNAFWSIIFFSLRNPVFAFFEIIVLWITILGSCIAFFKSSKLAGFLLLPYLLWVSFAAYLNYSIWKLN